jgi:DNA polymerase III delta prime subunit
MDLSSVRNRVRDEVQRMWSSFDNRQRAAVNAILNEWNSAEEDAFVFPIVDGPPGTGKTTVAAVAIAQYLLENPRGKVLYMCYTNFAAGCAQQTLFNLGFTEEHAIRIPANPRERAPGVLGFRELSDLSDDEERRLRTCPILLCTLYRAEKASRLRGEGTRVIVDEFSQVNVPMFFATIERVKGLNPKGYALLGDPKQLPVVSTQPLLYQNICSYIMGRKVDYTPHPLVLQHRMHRAICAAVNSLRRALGTYDIQTSPRIEDRNLTHPLLGYTWDRRAVFSPLFQEILDPQHPFVIVNTDGLGGQEQESYRGSLRNEAEASFAAELARAFYTSFRRERGEPLLPTILSPYSAQVTEISRRLPPQLQERCMTIFRAQGREYPCVIISFVRNNPRRFIGFLDEPQLRAQTYVACSRPQAKLVVLFSFQTFLNAGHADFDYLYRTPGAHVVET